MARARVAVHAEKLAISPGVFFRTHARMAAFHLGTHASVLARAALAEVDLCLAMPAHITGAAIAVEIVDQLHAVQRAVGIARVGQAFVDVTFAPVTDETGRATAVEASDPIYAGAVVVASVGRAVVDVDVANDAERARRTRAAEAVDQIAASAAVLARVRMAIVDVQFAVLPLEPARALARVSRDQIPARGPVLAGRRVAFVDLFRAVTAGITVGAVAPVAVANVLAHAAVVAQTVAPDTLAEGRVVAGHHFHVAHLARPTGLAQALVQVLHLFARRTVLARLRYTATGAAPVHQRFAVLARVAVRAMARVVFAVVKTGAAVLARRRIAFVYSGLTIQSGVPVRQTIKTRYCRLSLNTTMQVEGIKSENNNNNSNIRVYVPGRAYASVVVNTVHTSGTVHARRIGAVLVVGLTVHAGKANRASASIRIHVLFASGSVQTRLRYTFVHVHFAMATGETVRAHTGVITDAVKARGSVLARC